MQINFCYVIIENQSGIAVWFFLISLLVYKTICICWGCASFGNYCLAPLSAQFENQANTSTLSDDWHLKHHKGKEPVLGTTDVVLICDKRDGFWEMYKKIRLLYACQPHRQLRALCLFSDSTLHMSLVAEHLKFILEYILVLGVRASAVWISWSNLPISWYGNSVPTQTKKQAGKHALWRAHGFCFMMFACLHRHDYIYMLPIKHFSK